MKKSTDRLCQLYKHSLRLYPRSFRETYDEELCVVFNLAVEEAAGDGFFGLLVFVCRELRDLPMAVFVSHARERRRLAMQRRLNRWFIQDPGSWQEVILAITPYLLLCLIPGFLSATTLDQSIPPHVGLLILGGIVGILAVLGLISLSVELPRWSMPYAGIPMALVVLLGLFALNARFTFFNGGPTDWWTRMLGFLGIYLVVLVTAMMAAVWMSGKLTRTRSFFNRVKKDWTLISFCMYGSALIFVVGMYEDLHGAGWYLVLTAILLILGVWIYLRSQDARHRMLALTLSIGLAMLIALIANIQLMDWASPIEINIGPLAINRATVSVLLTWLACEVMILAPGILIPRSDSQISPA
jgi:hypothetical protein